METAGYDLIIAGAGPAGSACAITAARAGMRVLLLEKDRFPRQKVCGEFVSAESLELLRALLCEKKPGDENCGEKELGSYAAVAGARFFVDGKCVRLPLSPPARSVPRYWMDAALFQAAREAGAATLEGITVLEARRKSNDLFHVETEQGAFSARAMVNTTGRWSRLTQFDVAGKQRWLGLKAHFTEPKAPASVDLYFFSGGYCGVTPVDDHTVNACAMVHAATARSLEEVFALEPELERRSRHWQPVFPAVTTSPLYFREPETEAEGMLLAGDAAGFIDPFAGDGISLALQSGTLAAVALIPFVREKCSLEETHRFYRAAYRKRFAPAFRNAARIRSALAAPRWLRNVGLTIAGVPGVGRMLVRGTRAKL